MDTSIAFNRFLLTQLNERLGQFIGMVEYERLLEPDARVARCLAELFNPYLYPGNRAELEISQEEIGYLSGVSRQRVNQASAGARTRRSCSRSPTDACASSTWTNCDATAARSMRPHAHFVRCPPRGRSVPFGRPGGH